MTKAAPPVVKLTCEQCFFSYEMTEKKHAWYVQFHGVRRYCSKECYHDAIRARFDAVPAPTFACKHCGKVQDYPLAKSSRNNRGRKFVHKQQYCDQTCATMGRKHSTDLPVGIKDRHGYIWEYSGGSGGKYIPQQRIVMQGMIGRPLRKEETVHHKNGIRTDNRPENLELWSSRHGKGQRITDKVAWCLEFLRDYPREVSAANHVVAAMAPIESLYTHGSAHYVDHSVY